MKAISQFIFLTLICMLVGCYANTNLNMDHNNGKITIASGNKPKNDK